MAEYHWTPQDAAGNDLPSTDGFASRAEAEAWMGQEWSALLAAGAEYVKLIEDGRVVYRMGLREE